MKSLGVRMSNHEGFMLWLAFAVLVLITYLLGGVLPVMDIDAAQYASIATEMLQNNSFLEIHFNGQDYLDKPPLLFWSSALSYSLFGINNFSYKLPSLLSTLLTIISIYKFSRIYYSKTIGIYAAILFITCQACFLFNHDVRTDTLLTAFVTYAIWQLGALVQSGKPKHFYGAALGLGLALLSKGPIGLMVPILAIGIHLIFSGGWKSLWSCHLVGGLILVGLIILPMCVGLYHQFDLHPEKVVNGKTGVSGLYFYFWEQSFGRVTGESSWKDESGPLYFIMAWMWAFMPWVILSLTGIFRGIANVIYRNRSIEQFTLGGFIIPFLVLSTSNYKLPHYIFILFPLLSIITAVEISKHLTQIKKSIHYISLLLYIPVGAFLFYVFPANVLFIFCLAGLGITLLWLGWKVVNQKHRLVFVAALSSVLFNIILNGHFYPNLFNYQSSLQSIHYLQKSEIPATQVTFINISPFGLRFFYKSPVGIGNDEQIKNQQIQTPWIVTDSNGKTYALQSYPNAVVEKKIPGYPISRLSANFLNPKTREGTINFAYLIRIKN